jgi:hypothetical protein
MEATQAVEAPSSTEVNESTEATEGQETATQEAAPVDTTPEWKKQKHKLKIDKEELEVDYDELVKRAQLSSGAEKRMLEAKGIKESFNKLIKDGQKDPEVILNLLEKLGHNVDSIIEERLWNKIQREKMTPEERQREDERAELARLRAEREAIESEKKRGEESAKEQAVGTQIEDNVEQVFRLTGIKPTPRSVARVAEVYHAIINAKIAKAAELEADGMEVPEYLTVPPTPEEIAKQVRQYHDASIVDLLDGVDIGEAVERGLITKDLLERINKYQLSKAQKNLPGFNASKPAGSEPAKPKARNQTKLSDFFR